MMIFADANPSPQALSDFMQVLSLLVSLGASAVSMVAFSSSRRVQRREVSFTREMASKEELLHIAKDLERIEKGLAEIRAENKDDRQLIMAALEARLEKVTVRVDRLLEGVTRLEKVSQ